MHALRSVLEQAQQMRVAVGHFNVADLVLLKAVFVSAQELKVPVLVGVSEGERGFMGVPQIAVLVRSLREEFDFPIFLNADHTHSLVKAVEAAKAGFDAVVFDLSALPFEQNVRQTKEAVEALKAINPSILVEGEIGDIGTGSEIHTEAPDLSKSLTTPEEARQFVESTGVDILAPRTFQKVSRLLRKPDNSSSPRVSISSLPPWATGTACSRAWFREKRGSIWISKESLRSKKRRASC